MTKKHETPKVGQFVIFFDQFGLEHNALLTCIHGESGMQKYYPVGTTEYKEENLVEKFCHPSVNLVLVSPDKKREDTYGRQLERQTSCVHHKEQSAYGNFYCFTDEAEEARANCEKAKMEYANM